MAVFVKVTRIVPGVHGEDEMHLRAVSINMDHVSLIQEAVVGDTLCTEMLHTNNRSIFVKESTELLLKLLTGGYRG